MNNAPYFILAIPNSLFMVGEKLILIPIKKPEIMFKTYCQWIATFVLQKSLLMEWIYSLALWIRSMIPKL